MKIYELSEAFNEMFDFITDLPSGLAGFESDFEEAFEQLKQVKTDEVQEVVRCKDCAYDDCCSVQEYCGLKAYDFCSRAVRRVVK